MVETAFKASACVPVYYGLFAMKTEFKAPACTFTAATIVVAEVRTPTERDYM